MAEHEPPWVDVPPPPPDDADSPIGLRVVREPSPPAAARVITDTRSIVTPAQALDRLRDLAALPVIGTGYTELDEKLAGGLRATQVYVVATGTGAGKTSWVVQVCGNHALLGHPVVIATYELDPGMLAARMTSQRTGKSWLPYLRGEGLDDLSIHVPESVRFFTGPVAQLPAAIRTVSAEFGEEPLVAVDYLQKLAALETQDPRQAVTAVSDQLRRIAVQCRVPMLVVSATSRAAYSRIRDSRDTAPGDLVDVSKESGAIEYDAAAVLVLSVASEGDPAEAVISIAKNRFGPRGRVANLFHGASGRFEETGAPVINSKQQRREADILAAVRSKGQTGMPSKNAIYAAVGGTKQSVLDAVNAMLAAGSLRYLGGVIHLGEGA